MQKLILILIISGILGFSTSQVFAQQFNMGAIAVQDLKVRIEENGTVHVVHIVQGNGTSPIQVETIAGNMTNLSVTDSDGNPANPIMLGTKPVTVVIPPTNRQVTLIKYDLNNVLTFNNGIWHWNYYEPKDTAFTDFYFPQGVKLVWSADRPVYIGDAKGIRQYGNGLILDYTTLNEPTVYQDVEWGGQHFTVGIKTLSNVGTYAFDQGAKSFAFDISKPHSFVTVIMPQALLWGPYDTTINGKPTLHTIYLNNGTHVWIGLRPATSGTLQFTGTTVVPEFPMFVPLVIAISIVVALQFKSRLNFR